MTVKTSETLPLTRQNSRGYPFRGAHESCRARQPSGGAASPTTLQQHRNGRQDTPPDHPQALDRPLASTATSKPRRLKDRAGCSFPTTGYPARGADRLRKRKNLLRFNLDTHESDEFVLTSTCRKQWCVERIARLRGFAATQPARHSIPYWSGYHREHCGRALIHQHARQPQRQRRYVCDQRQRDEIGEKERKQPRNDIGRWRAEQAACHE